MYLRSLQTAVSHACHINITAGTGVFLSPRDVGSVYVQCTTVYTTGPLYHQLLESTWMLPKDGKERGTWLEARLECIYQCCSRHFCLRLGAFDLLRIKVKEITELVSVPGFAFSIPLTVLT